MVEIKIKINVYFSFITITTEHLLTPCILGPFQNRVSEDPVINP